MAGLRVYTWKQEQGVIDAERGSARRAERGQCWGHIHKQTHTCTMKPITITNQIYLNFNKQMIEDRRKEKEGKNLIPSSRISYE